jgi:hypothetical protein
VGNWKEGGGVATTVIFVVASVLGIGALALNLPFWADALCLDVLLVVACSGGAALLVGRPRTGRLGGTLGLVLAFGFQVTFAFLLGSQGPRCGPVQGDYVVSILFVPVLLVRFAFVSIPFGVLSYAFALPSLKRLGPLGRFALIGSVMMAAGVVTLLMEQHLLGPDKCIDF